MVELWGQEAFDRLIASGRIVVDGAERAESGRQTDLSRIQGNEQDRPSDQSPEIPADTGERDTNAWDTAEGEKPERDSIHVSDARRVHMLDGDGLGNGGHLSGTGLPTKTEFPASWDDDKIIGAIEDVARNPDSPPVLQDRDRWATTGRRDGVEIKVVVEMDSGVCTGYPLRGIGVVQNDEYGNPRPLD